VVVAEGVPLAEEPIVEVVDGVTVLEGVPLVVPVGVPLPLPVSVPLRVGVPDTLFVCVLLGDGEGDVDGVYCGGGTVGEGDEVLVGDPVAVGDGDGEGDGEGEGESTQSQVTRRTTWFLLSAT